MVGGFSNDHAVRSGTNLQLCSRCLNVVTHASGISIQGVCRRYRLFYFILFYFLYAPYKAALPGKLRMA